MSIKSLRVEPLFHRLTDYSTFFKTKGGNFKDKSFAVSTTDTEALVLYAPYKTYLEI